HRSQRAGRPAGGPRPLDHDPADDHRDQPRRAGLGAAEAADGGVRTRRNALGSAAGRDSADRIAGNFRRHHPRLRPRPRRDDGARDAGRQFQSAEPVDVLAGKYPRGAAREQLSGSGRAGGRRPDVRGPRAARDHARGERDRRLDHRAREPRARGLSGDMAPENHAGGAQLIEPVDPLAGVDLSALERSLLRPRTLLNFLLSGIVTTMTLVSLIPLVSVVLMLLWRGGQRLSIAAFTELPPAPLEQGGGFGNAIVGTLIMVAIVVLMTVPFGLLT